MSYFPSPVLVRLQELRLWQGNYDSLLQNQSVNKTGESDYDTIEGISALDSSPSTPSQSPTKERCLDWDKKPITPPKPFEQLLEEKLAEEEPVRVSVTEKRPFLKKGAGLQRYKLNQNAKKTLPIKKKPARRNPTPSVSQSKSSWKTELKKSKHDPVTPLKVPDVCFKPKAKWVQVECDKENIASGNDDNFRLKSKSPVNSHFNSHIIQKINEFASKRLNLSPIKHGNGVLSEIQTKTNKSNAPTYLEKNSERDLLIFEALEEKAENSSFCSTNSSIIRILTASSPKKAQMPVIREKNSPEVELSDSDDSKGLRQRLEEVNIRSDVLQKFLNNLKKIGDTNDIVNLQESVESSNHSSKQDSSFSDDERWSNKSNTDECESFYTDFETTFRGNLKVDAAVNTSSNEEESWKTVENEVAPCAECQSLKMKLEELNKTLPDIQAEKAKVCDFVKDLEKKRDQLSREMKKMEENYEREIKDLKREVESEKKRSAREKSLFDAYMKESQNRPSKKEREEISNLKRELSDAKELMKLKETKNGATQARLRTQVKQLEKENTEIKLANEKLQRENSKLNASKKTIRPTEVKMLHEINKNLTKLTQETMKKTNRSDFSCNTEEVKVADEKEDSFIAFQEHKKRSCMKNVQTNSQNLVEETNSTDNRCFVDMSLEKQYENVFRNNFFGSRENSSLNDSKKEKTEKILEDGSKEIKYSNGNTKTISSDGQKIVVKYYNGDVKETNLNDTTLKYFYAESSTWHSQFADGSELFEYPSGQKEKRYKDGKKEISCVDGSFLTKLPDGTEETVYVDGSKIVTDPSGGKTLLLPNGQKEIHTKEHKRREYPDGTVKILYPDGTQETRYMSGRIRIKDVNGILIMDSFNRVS